MTIYKFPFVKDNTVLALPIGAKVLCVQMQNNTPTMWVLGDFDAKPAPVCENRRFQWFNTGIILPNMKMNYVGTCQFANGIVQHCFEITT